MMINNNNNNNNNNKNNSYNFTTTFTAEGMPFTYDETSFYQQEPEEEEINEQEKSYGDDFRPTFYNPFEIKHRRRTSRAQFKVLERTFLENPKPNAAIRRWLAQKLVMTPRGVQVWFQNRRAKEKTVNSKKSASSTTTSKASTSTQSTTPILCSESTLSLSPLQSQPLTKQASHQSNHSNSYEDVSFNHSPQQSSCTCNEHHFTPMSRNMSYPPFYHSDASNADDEELIMTPVTPFVDNNQLQQQPMYDYPMFVKFQQQQDWLQQCMTNLDSNKNDFTYNNQPLQQQQPQQRRVYNNVAFDESRRFSQPPTMMQHSFENEKFFSSEEVFRRLSEPIFDTDINFNYTTQPIFDNAFDFSRPNM